MSLQIEFISPAVIEKSGKEKLNYVLDAVRKGDKILVLEEPLTSQEQSELIKMTMLRVDKKFTGIEVATLGNASIDLATHLVRLLGGRPAGLTVVGPSRIIKEIKRDPNKLNLLARR